MNMLKKGPELKMPEIKVPDFLLDLYYDLRERHLLPLVALLLVAIVALPIVLSSGSSESESAGSEAAVATPGASAPSSKLIVAKAAPGLRDYRRRLTGTPKDPFEQKYTTPEGEGNAVGSAPATESPSSGGSESASVTTESTTTETTNSNPTETSPHDAERRQRRTVERRAPEVLLLRDRRSHRPGLLGRKHQQSRAFRPPQPAGADDAAQPQGAGADLHGRQQGRKEGPDAGLRQGHRPLRRRRLRGRLRTLPAHRPRKGHPRDRRLRAPGTHLPHRAAEAPPPDQQAPEQGPAQRLEGKWRQVTSENHLLGSRCFWR